MNREPSLDALRGIAILGMVLSGSIAFGGVLPAWMYHAQVPPPLHQFDPSLPGITWVDLVFPFFLFSMGAAFPLSLRGAIDQNKNTRYFVRLAAIRFFLLAFFALFTQHMKAWVMAPDPGTTFLTIGLCAFGWNFLPELERTSGQLPPLDTDWMFGDRCFIIGTASFSQRKGIRPL
jgi:predicted acyltransferase